MIAVNEPQVWTLIGVFAASLMGVLTFMSTIMLRFIEAKFEAVDARFDAMDRRFDHLDRDVQAIARRVFPDRD